MLPSVHERPFADIVVRKVNDPMAAALPIHICPFRHGSIRTGLDPVSCFLPTIVWPFRYGAMAAALPIHICPFRHGSIRTGLDPVSCFLPTIVWPFRYGAVTVDFGPCRCRHIAPWPHCRWASGRSILLAFSRPQWGLPLPCRRQGAARSLRSIYCPETAFP